jgi:Zn ribbon nucleic-acid-binding protein
MSPKIKVIPEIRLMQVKQPDSVGARECVGCHYVGKECDACDCDDRHVWVEINKDGTIKEVVR